MGSRADSNKAELRETWKRACVISRRDFQFHATGRGCRGRGADGPEERAGRENLRRRFPGAWRTRRSRSSACSQQVPGFTELTVVRELGQPSVQIEVDREKIARYGINVSDVEGSDSGRRGRAGCDPGDPGRELFDLVVRMKPEYRSSAHDIGNLLVPTPPASRCRFPSWPRCGRETGRHSSIAKIIHGISACNSASRGATLRVQWTRRKKP